MFREIIVYLVCITFIDYAILDEEDSERVVIFTIT